MRPQTMATAFVSVKMALDNCKRNHNGEWRVRWHERLNALVQLIPSGSGIDQTPRTELGVEIEPDAIRFDVGYHHMNSDGFYTGWTEHTVTIRPAFDGINVRVSGPNRNDVKDYIHEVMNHAFTRHVTWDEPARRWFVESDEERYRAERRAYPTPDEVARDSVSNTKRCAKCGRPLASPVLVPAEPERCVECAGSEFEPPSHEQDAATPSARDMFPNDCPDRD